MSPVKSRIRNDIHVSGGMTNVTHSLTRNVTHQQTSSLFDQDNVSDLKFVTFITHSHDSARVF